MSPKPHGFTADELALLTDEEREGLLDPNFVDDPADGSAPEVVEPVVETPPAPEPAPGAEIAPAPAPAPKVTEPVQQEPAAPAPAPTMPVYTAPADIDDQLKAVRAEQAALAEKFDAGDLTARELHEQTRALEDKYYDLRDVRTRAAQSYDAQLNTWANQTVKDFLSGHADAYGDTEGFLYDALDREVARLQVGEYKDDKFNPAILQRAHERIQQGIGAIGGAPKPKTPGEPDRQIPPRLSNIPAAAEDSLDAGGDFAYLDRLQGQAYEDAFAKLNPAQQEAYLAS